MIVADFFARKQEVYGRAGTAAWTIKKHVHIAHLMVDKTDRLKRAPSCRKIGSSNQNIDIPGVPDSILIHARDPLRDRVAPNHRIRQRQLRPAPWLLFEAAP